MASVEGLGLLVRGQAATGTSASEASYQLSILSFRVKNFTIYELHIAIFFKRRNFTFLHCPASHPALGPPGGKFT
jgi:hypothetical protein